MSSFIILPRMALESRGSDCPDVSPQLKIDAGLPHPSVWRQAFIPVALPHPKCCDVVRFLALKSSQTSEVPKQRSGP